MRVPAVVRYPWLRSWNGRLAMVVVLGAIYTSLGMVDQHHPFVRAVLWGYATAALVVGIGAFGQHRRAAAKRGSSPDTPSSGG